MLAQTHPFIGMLLVIGLPGALGVGAPMIALRPWRRDGER